jgi:hypothetical protein
MKYILKVDFVCEAYVEVEADNLEKAKEKADDIVFYDGIESLYVDYASYGFEEVEESPEWAF